MKNFTLLVVLFISTFFYANQKVEVYRNNNINEIKFDKKPLSIYHNNEKLETIIVVGSDFEGKITSISIETENNTISLEKVFNLNEMQTGIKKVVEYISGKFINNTPNGIGEPAALKCARDCNKTYDCYNKPTEAGAFLCLQDCFIECYILPKSNSIQNLN